jgi:hypothetical protein
VNTLLDLAALLVTGAALLAAAVVLATTRQVRQALPVLLDLLTAAGLLRLAGTPSWTALLVTATIIALRHLLAGALRMSPGAARR